MAQKYLELTEEQLAKIAKRKRQDEASKVSPEWRLLSEFGTYYGFSGVTAVMENEIDTYTFNNLLSGARKVWADKVLDMSTATFAGVAATKSKNPQSVMNKNLAKFYKEVK